MAGGWVRVALGIFLLAFVVVGCSFSLAGDGDGLFSARDASGFGDGARAELFIVSTASLTMVEAQPNQPRAKVEFNVRLAQPPTADVVVPAAITPAGRLTIAPSSLLFTPVNWSTAQTFTIDAETNAEIDPPRFKVALGPATSTDTLFAGADPADVTIEFTDTNEAIAIEPRFFDAEGKPKNLQVSERKTSARFQVWLNKVPDGDVDVTCTSELETEVVLAVDSAPTGGVDGGDDAGGDGGADLPFGKSATLFFPKNTPIGKLQTIVAMGVDDKAQDGKKSVPITCVSQSTQDPIFAGRTAAPYVIDNIDDEEANVIFSTTTVSATEGAAAGTFTITLTSMPAQPPVELDIQNSNPSEGTVTPATVTIDATNWETGVTVSVTATDDALADGNQTGELTFTMRTADPAYLQLGPLLPKVAVTYNDNEVAQLVVSKNNLTTTEGGGSDSFVVTLTSQPTSDVTIVITNGLGGEVAVAPNTFTLGASNWNTGQLVTVTGQDDSFDDGNASGNLTVAVQNAAGQNPIYLGAAPHNVSVTNQDNDTAAVITGPNVLTLNEGGVAGSFAVRLAARPQQPVSVTLTPNPGSTGATVSPGSVTLAFDGNNWASNQSATFQIPEDCYYGDQNIPVAVQINIGADLAYNAAALIGGRSPDVAISHIDNEPVPTITVSPTSVTTEKSPAVNATFTVQINTRPRTDIQLPIASGDTMKGTVSASSANFPAASLLCPPDPVQITITPGNNTGSAYTVTVGADSRGGTDPDYRNQNPADVSVTPNP